MDIYIYICIYTYTYRERHIQGVKGKSKASPKCKIDKEESHQVKQQRHCTAISRHENCIAAPK